jgi:hypothetical protein
MKRFRLRFLVRRLAIFVMLVCAYLAVWEVTKKWGVGIPGPFSVTHAYSPLPLVIAEEERQHFFADGVGGPRKHYLWLFGPRFKLPFDSTWFRRYPANKNRLIYELTS